MITETTYNLADLHYGRCEWCGNESDEIVYTNKGEEVCIDCIEEYKFYQETMRGL